VAQAVEEGGLAEMVPMGDYAFLWTLDDVGRVLNLLYQQDLFAVGDVEYANRAKIHLVMPRDRKEKAEAWLTESLSRPVALDEEKTFFEECPVEPAQS
jgi:hypothetical protein